MSKVQLLSSATAIDDRNVFTRRHVPAWIVSAITFLCLVAPAKAEYRVEVGDVIEISVARVPELQRRVPVQLDGSISFPLLGSLTVAGLFQSEVQAKIQATLAAKVFRQRTYDGRESAIAIEPDEVTANVVEYRPIYINGDVSKPGEYPYRPYMTVRQAVAQAGGYDALHARISNPFLESADLRSDYETLWIEYAKGQSQIWRIKFELGDETNLNEKTLMEVPIPRSTAAEIIKVETDHLKARQNDFQHEQAYLHAALTQSDEQIKALSDQAQKEEEGTQADIDELQRVTDLFGKGTLPSPRVTESRRAVLLSSTRKLQTVAQLMQVKRQQQDLSRQLEKLDDQRRIELLKELQDANTHLAEVRNKLQSVGEKLQYTAMAKSQFTHGTDGKPSLTLLRRSEHGQEHVAATEETELQPGDGIEIEMRRTRNAGLTEQ